MKFINSVSQIDKTQWEALVQTSAVASFFQTPRCYEFYSELSFIEPFAFAITRNSDLQAVAIGYVEKNGFRIFENFTKRAIIQGGILFKNDIENEIINVFLDKIIENINKKAVFLEIRNLNNFSQWINDFQKSGFVYQRHFNIFVQITNKEQVLYNFSQSKRRQLTIAQRNGSQIEQIIKTDEITEYYAYLRKLYKRKIGTPLFPLEFFVILAQKNFGKIFAVKKNNKIIGGIVVVTFSGKVVYEWFICGSDKIFHDNFPSVVATWAGIDFALKTDIPKFDFMGAGVPEKPYGVREFKSKFGGKQVEYGRFCYIFSPLKYKFGKIGIKILKILK